MHAHISQLSVKHGFYSLHSFSAHELRVSTSLDPGIDIGHIERFYSGRVFHYNPMMYFDSNVIYKCD